MNRRSVLVGLGTIVAGGGAALGTGAFTTVEADRTVSVSTSGDGSAFLSISGNSEYVTDGDNDTTNEFVIDLGSHGSQQGSGFNENAKTVLNDVLTITNQGSSDGVTIGFAKSIGSGSSSSETIGVSGVGEVTFTIGSGSNPLAAATGSDDGGASLNVDITIDTTVDSPSDDGSIVIVADTA
ncbi:hypothetical protein SAMN04488694_103214 [Natrinema hispanicum]|uniref:DUF1102 domain-containing protein n=2 Tax=Natrinema hispanicum TaxID=392421 RepID=A0A1I0BG09_9EURY|nr:hypothetical protein SAMN04488694_103214 [Natrinema hispanicum]